MVCVQTPFTQIQERDARRPSLTGDRQRPRRESLRDLYEEPPGSVMPNDADLIVASRDVEVRYRPYLVEEVMRDRWPSRRSCRRGTP